MVKMTKKQKEENMLHDAAKLKQKIEQSRMEWLEKRVFFLGFLNFDCELREGRFIEVRDDGEVIFKGPIYPWSADDEIISVDAGGESELLSVLTGTVVDEDASLGEGLGHWA